MPNSRNKGHAFERKIVQELRELGFEKCGTSRNESKKRDDEKVDLVGTDPWNFQCKAQERGVYPHDILESMPDEDNTNVLIHKKNRKGVVVSMMWEDFKKLIK